jgi:hypothetical protein
VAGITHSYSPFSLPRVIVRGMLPALLILPGDDGRAWPSAVDDFTATAFPGGARTMTLRVTHLLLASRAEDGVAPHLPWPTLTSLTDAYVAALAASPTLGGLLREPTRVRVEPGRFDYASEPFWGVRLRHWWLLTY